MLGDFLSPRLFPFWIGEELSFPYCFPPYTIFVAPPWFDPSSIFLPSTLKSLLPIVIYKPLNRTLGAGKPYMFFCTDFFEQILVVRSLNACTAHQKLHNHFPKIAASFADATELVYKKVRLLRYNFHDNRHGYLPLLFWWYQGRIFW